MLSNTPKKVFLYARRSSTKNQKNALSVGEQLDKMRSRAKERGYEIIKEFSETKSSYTPGKRGQFNAMISEIKRRNIHKKDEHIDIIIVYTVSRLARNSEEGYILADLMEREIIDIESLNENSITSTNDGKKAFKDMLAEAAYESNKKSSEAMRYMDATYKKGRMAQKVAFGYKTVKDGGIITIEKDTTDYKDKIVEKVFEYYLTEKYTFESLAKELSDKKKWTTFVEGDEIQDGQYYKMRKLRKTDEYGNSQGTIIKDVITKGDVENILNKEFYMGKVSVIYGEKVPLTREELEYFGKLYPLIEPMKGTITVDYSKFFKGTFKTYVDKKVFDKCRLISKGRGGPKNVVDKNIHSWRGLLRCPCEAHFQKEPLLYRTYTSEEKIKSTKTGEMKYIYYRCSQMDKNICHNGSISEVKIEKEIMPILKKLNFDDKEIELWSDFLEYQLNNNVTNIEITKKNLLHTQEVLEKEIDYLFERSSQLVAGSVFAIKNEEKAEEKNKELQETKIKLLALQNKPKEENNVNVKEKLMLAKDLYKNISKGSVKKKHKILHSIFNYIIFDNGKIVDYKLSKLFEAVKVLRAAEKKKSSTGGFGGGETSKSQVELKEMASEGGVVGLGSSSDEVPSPT